MARDIQSLLNNILNAVYGRDVRSSIHDAIEMCYGDVSEGKTIAETAASTIGTAVTNATNAANSANAAATSATNAAAAANTAASNVSSIMEDASDAATAAAEAATNAATAANAAQNATTAANTAVAAANTAIASANEAIATIEAIDIDVESATAAISRADSAASAATSAAAAANAAVIAAEDATLSATNAAAAANTATTSCQQATTSANTAVATINAAKDAANTAATNANNARDAANTATSAANTAATNATTAASNANAAITSANAKIAAMDSKLFDAEAAINSANAASSAANTAASSANTAASTINNLTVDSEDVGPGTAAAAILQTVNGHKNIHFLLRQGASGASFIVKGHAYATISALQEDISDPEVGDQYNVGSAPPYHIYRWTGTAWEDQGVIGSDSEPISAQDVQAIQNGREIENASIKVMKVEALTYLLQTLLVGLLNNKVDKVSGKGLSTNDFTTEYITAINDATSAISVLSENKVNKVTGKGLSTNDLTDALLNKIVLIGDGSLGTTASTIIGAINELLSGKAAIASPVFTGTPQAPTVASASDNSTKIATTAFVQSALTSAVDGKVDAVQGKGLSTNDFTDALKDQVELIGTDTLTTTAATIIAAINELVSGKAQTNHASTASTYGVGSSSNYGHVKLSTSTSSTSDDTAGIAATPSAVKAAYDLANGKPALGSSTPVMDGTGAAGVATTAAKSDHVHPSDTSRAPVSHASTATDYGIGTSLNYGHVKLSASTSSTSGDTDGIAATPSAVKAAYDLANGKPSLGSTAGAALGTAAAGSATTAARSDHVHPTDTSRAPTAHASTATTYGIGTNSNYGHVKLSDSTSTSSGQTAGIAATPTAVKSVNDAKQDKNIYVTSKSVAASSWASNSTYSSAGYTYRAAIAITGVTASMFAQVVFSPADVLSGNYAPVCETYAGGVYIYSKTNTAITIPTIAVFK